MTKVNSGMQASLSNLGPSPCYTTNRGYPMHPSLSTLQADGCLREKIHRDLRLLWA